MTKGLLAWVLLGALTPGLRAAEVVTNAAGFAFPTLQAGAGARAIALGSTYVGIDEGSASLLWNPAGLGTLMDPEIAEHHNAALMGQTQDIAVLGLPLGRGNGLGISLDYENDGTFNARDINGADLGEYTAYAYGGSLGWGVNVMEGLSLGVAVKFNQENLAGTDLNAFAGDLGALWNISPWFTLGAAYTNFGPNVNGFQLDQALSAGFSSYFYRGEDSRWLAALSSELQKDGNSSLHFGLENTIFKMFSLRGGYAFSTSGLNSNGSDLMGWTFGAGIVIRDVAVDYAYVPLSTLGAMQRISITYNFGCHCLDAPVTTLVPNETMIVLNDDDFERSATGNGREQLTKEAQEHLYQALTQVTGVLGAALKVTGESSALKHSGIAGDKAQLIAVGQMRIQVVTAYVQQEMPRASVTGELIAGSEKDTSASLFEVEVH